MYVSRPEAGGTVCINASFVDVSDVVHCAVLLFTCFDCVHVVSLTIDLFTAHRATMHPVPS